jgi:hypothetical protein
LIAICVFAVYLYILRRNKTKVIRGGLCQTNNKHVRDRGMRRKLGWGISVFGNELLKEVRYIFNEYAVLGDKICF